MAASISTVAQTIAVDGIGSLNLTTIEQDPTSGLYVRELRLYEDDGTGVNGRLVLTVRVSAATKEGVEQTTPQLKF